MPNTVLFKNAVNTEEVRDALKEFDKNFLTPSIERRKAIIKQGSGEDLPNDILTVLLVNDDQLNMPYDVLQREIAFYLLAGAQTSIHSLVHVFHEIHSWLKENPEREDDIKNDPIFVQKCFLESTRLHPSSPVALRKPVCPVQLPGNKNANEDDSVVIDLYNSKFLIKTNEALKNLHYLNKNKLITKNDITILKYYRLLDFLGLKRIISKLFNVFSKYIESNLKGSDPSLFVFDLFIKISVDSLMILINIICKSSSVTSSFLDNHFKNLEYSLFNFFSDHFGIFNNTL